MIQKAKEEKKAEIEGQESLPKRSLTDLMAEFDLEDKDEDEDEIFNRDLGQLENDIKISAQINLLKQVSDAVLQVAQKQKERRLMGNFDDKYMP